MCLARAVTAHSAVAKQPPEVVRAVHSTRGGPSGPSGPLLIVCGAMLCLANSLCVVVSPHTHIHAPACVGARAPRRARACIVQH
jgi:hypothetical protein